MIERFYLKECLSFNVVDLELKAGLVVFSGASGSGKSVLLNAILASLGLQDTTASISECSVSWSIDEMQYGLINEHPNVLKCIKKNKSRYFFNHQSISRSLLKEISSSHLRYLSLKEYSDFNSKNLLEMIDVAISIKNQCFTELLLNYKQKYFQYKKISKELLELQNSEQELRQQEEFARFEFDKIESIDPKIGEYEESLIVKKSLSKKEKLEQLLLESQQVFNSESSVCALLQELEIESGFFDECMNELRAHFESIEQRFHELEDVDIEQVLDRLQMLSELKNRYGSIEEALNYRDLKAKELNSFETLELRITELRTTLEDLLKSLQQDAKTISSIRKSMLDEINNSINSYLKQLYLDNASLDLTPQELDESGCDNASLKLMSRTLQQVSQGEFNRLRLALLATRSEQLKGSHGVLMLDEIDANLSGEESMSVAKVLRVLSRHFQILVISHQPQLTALGEQHFLVKKDGGISSVEELDTQEKRIDEIARIVSGESITPEAKKLAQTLIKDSLELLV